MADLSSLKSSVFLTSRWKEISRTGSGTQVNFRFGHYNPEANIDKTYGEGNKVLEEKKSETVVETTSTVGIHTAKGNNLTAFYDGSIAMIQQGFMTGITVAQIEDLRAKNNVVFPEDCDFWTDLSVAKLPSKEAAAQTLANMAGTSGKSMVDQAIPGGTGMSMRDAFSNPVVLAAAKEKGVDQAQMDEVFKKFEAVSKEKDVAMKKAGMGFETGTFLGKPAVFMKMPNMNKDKPKPQPRKSGIPVNKVTRPDGSVIEVAGGGGFDTRVKLPANWQNKEEFPIDGHMLHAIQVGPYIITGSHIGSYNMMPTGKSFTQSLTKFKTETKTMLEGGVKFIDHFIAPEHSDFASEGYVHREEIEAMLKRLISALEV